jgi:hypothetical protein
MKERQQPNHWKSKKGIPTVRTASSKLKGPVNISAQKINFAIFKLFFNFKSVVFFFFASFFFNLQRLM